MIRRREGLSKKGDGGRDCAAEVERRIERFRVLPRAAALWRRVGDDVVTDDGQHGARPVSSHLHRWHVDRVLGAREAGDEVPPGVDRLAPRHTWGWPRKSEV